MPSDAGRRCEREPAELSVPTWLPVPEIRRAVRDGAAILVEVAYPGGSGVSVADLERDMVTILDSSHGFGRVLYVSSATVDKSLAVIRM